MTMKNKVLLIIIIAEVIFIAHFRIVFGFGDSMYPTLKNGSVLLCRIQESYDVGDIVYYRINGLPVVHRITNIVTYDMGGHYITTYTLQGDNNEGQDDFNIYKENIVCKVLK